MAELTIDKKQLTTISYGLFCQLFICQLLTLAATLWLKKQ